MSNVEHAANVAISQDFLSSYTALPKKIQGKVSDFLDKFRKNPKSPGINYEKIRDAFDPGICSVRIDNTYRGIVVRQPDSSTYILLWVDHHDEAYEWARRKRCAVNPTTVQYSSSPSWRERRISYQQQYITRQKISRARRDSLTTSATQT